MSSRFRPSIVMVLTMSDSQICIMKNFNNIHYNAESVRKCNYIFMLLQINSPCDELLRNNMSIFDIACICRGYLQVLLINGRCGSNLQRIISNWLYRIVAWALTLKLFSCAWYRTSSMINQYFFEHVMVWCRQTAIHCLGQCWPGSMSPNGVNRPEWDK